ncbi:MAG: helix-turn-helix domain-containing protein [Bacteroides sp.]
MNVGERIKYFRTCKGYTVNKLANLAGISQSYLRDIELGNKNPTIELLSIVCNTLEVSLKDFFDDGAEDTPDEQLIKKINRLPQKQKDALLTFLDTILEA